LKIEADMITESIYEIVNRQNLTIDKTKQVMNEIMDGAATDAQIASFLTALKIKGETIEEITACAMVIHGHDGLDEVTLSDTTTVCEVNDGKINSFLLSLNSLD
jgi:anthranilate phosphoribosyltransferase